MESGEEGTVEGASYSAVVELVRVYYEKRGLKWPDTWQAMGWVSTELGEVYEQLLARDGGWVRNNPEKHGEWDREAFGEELGDCIFMLVVAGITVDVDPLSILVNKLTLKI